MGRSKRPISRQRAAGGCKAAGKSAEIPPGVASLKESRRGRVRPIQRKALSDAVRVHSVRMCRTRGGTAYVYALCLYKRTEGFLHAPAKGGLRRWISQRIYSPNSLCEVPEIRRRRSRAALQSAVTAMGCSYSIESGPFGCRNLVIGKQQTAKYLLTARYDEKDSSGLLTLLEIFFALPDGRRDRVCFVLLDKSRIGSDAYSRAHGKQTESQLVIHLDRVGNGDNLRFLPTKKLKEDRRTLTFLYKACGYFGPKSLLVEEKLSYRSCHCSFPLGVCLCAMAKNKKGRWIGPVKPCACVERTNITLLRAALISFLCCDTHE